MTGVVFAVIVELTEQQTSGKFEKEKILLMGSGGYAACPEVTQGSWREGRETDIRGSVFTEVGWHHEHISYH